MDQDAKPVDSREKHCGHHRHNEITPADDEIEEIEIPQNKTFYDKVTQVMEKFATTRLGQALIERTDRVLKVIEDTAKWSVTQDDKDVQLERPLPWLFFLSLIVWLRSLRIALSLASLVVRSQRVTPESMVYYIQIKRRRLRAIRVNGLKALRSREHESTVKSSDSGKRVTFLGKIRTVLGSAICKPGQQSEAPARRVFMTNDKAQCSKDMAERSTKRPRDDDSVDLNLTVDEMLDKYANEDSDADSDYIPKDDEDDHTISTSCTTSSSDETEIEYSEENDDIPEKVEKSASSQNENLYTEQSIVEIKENGGAQHQPLATILTDINHEAESGSEQVHTPKEFGTKNESNDLPQPTDIGATTEVATPQPDVMNTPNTTNKLLKVPNQIEEDKQKSTPGHISAATLKPAISTTAAGTPQDLHAIFHPAPIIKVSPADAHSIPKDAENLDDSSSTESPETAAKNPQKTFNYSNTNKQNHHYSAKNRNKNRR